jgi:tetratricopeptide (TPR) repeat protein
MLGISINISKATTLDKARISELYEEANELFRQANELSVQSPEKAKDLYEKSALRYERIIQEGGIKNGKLYYNLGNAYFRIKDIGRAILNYRRAEQYIPDDPNLKQNLEYAREKRLDQIDENQETKVLKTLFFWHYDLSTKIRVVLFAVSFIILWSSASIRIFIKKSFLKYFIVTSIILSIFLSGSLIAEEASFRNNRPGVIISNEVIARKGNSETYEPSFKDPLHSGTEFTVLEERGNWYRVELVDARTCWVPSNDVEMVR